MKKFSPGVWPTVMTIPAVLILLSLSFWQLNRYFWKVELISHLTERLSEDAVPLPAGALSLPEWGHKRVSVSGAFLNDKEIHLFSHAKKGRKGFQIITPMVRSDGGGIVLVNRGWVPEGKKEASNRKEGLISGPVDVTGVVRKPWTKSYDFLPDNNAEQNVWLYGDLGQMAARLKLDVAPVFVELDDLAVPGGWPKGGQTRVSVPNNHLEYFFTWLGLAFAMLAIYGIYGTNRTKKQRVAE
ncbi:MAG: SURF1 family protein [Sneathiella sp.]